MPHHGSTSPRRLIVLGSTGSIGVNTLAAVEHLHARTPHRFEVVGLAAGRNESLALEQASRFNVGAVAIADGDGSAGRGSYHGRTMFAGPDAARDLIESTARPGDLVVGAMVGSAGLPAILAAIERGCDIALANKETLVAAGEIVMPLVRAKGINLLPVDSEHSAIFQCLQAGRSTDEVARVVLTASGGPFRTRGAEETYRATVEEALRHPTWNMGAKVTIDSATLMNKALEVIEAHHLFGLEPGRIEAIVHPQSIVHSFVEFRDGSVFAQLSPPDMKSPIQYALTWPHRAEGCSRRLDWGAFRSLAFEPVDHDRFPAIRMAWEVIRRGGAAGAVFNAANEAAVGAFLDRRIPFGRIFELVAMTLQALPAAPVCSLNDVMRADDLARRHVDRLVEEAAEHVPSAGC
ncbi:MAG: 1-deoxy-D-xylulose-5-phosphate reductoisomerase [Phycisphaeraceae bacterium]|nr:1-deoxy-D-xylulose-5-phosphate reductoisomerase [Phycisphaerales bacterium]QOJ17842.1 MAG: 1-deoxy-D-xylulose-5-phosphate reductoisomerase [Phycisphaeraceae bacterium]